MLVTLFIILNMEKNITVKAYLGYITTPSAEDSKILAKLLLEAKLIACCNIIPKVESLFTWQNAVSVFTYL